ncbi:LytR/AlgR family response regulator transcription factor [Aequorivita echinoideorum]|uniref:LytTR family transcriptional regulator DNA-binding domain-containing protein n=1 Tax=Aequorivita echinoideorum TaxID=1549647 RepID=A0ABS5S2F6_9FLAO|nr:LytTR family transcriptional regulator DNA-binding domain-containing protein [Aequorivita echinoideorum]MBT0607387.1 LytTR family transcriptional regulator DNA-binding domain-containing protein [Aequorivita echinoideorum]
MDGVTKILIVEDEMVIAANISLQLIELGYDVTGIIPRGEEALENIAIDRPDIILMDIQLKGNLDGIATAQQIHKRFAIPIIYLTANTDEAHFNRAKETHPYAFISKPFKKLDLQRAIELTVDRISIERNAESKENGSIEAHTSENTLPYILNDRIFVRHNEKMLKIDIKDIYYIEADRNYSRIFTATREYLLVMTLKDIDEKLPYNHFLRIHRSYIINLSQINEVAGTHVVISKKAIPMSKSMRNELLSRLQTL